MSVSGSVWQSPVSSSSTIGLLLLGWLLCFSVAGLAHLLVVIFVPLGIVKETEKKWPVLQYRFTQKVATTFFFFGKHFIYSR